MTKKRIIISMIFIFVGVLTSYAIYSYVNRPLPVHPEVAQVKVYTDVSSFATFLQMVDVVKNDTKIPKLIFWNRMTKLPKNDPLFQNTVIIKPSFKMKRNFKRLKRQVVRFMHAYPNAKFILHLNKDQNALVWAILTTIPRERIEHIHWYEESFGATSFQIGYVRAPQKHALRILERKDPPPHFGINYALSLLPFYPSTIHMGLKDFVLENHPEIKKAFSAAQHVEDVDYLKIAAGLTEEQKHNLLRLAGVQEKDLLPFKQKKPVMLYALGFFADDKEFNKAQIAIMERLLAGEIVPIQPAENYTWFFKEHPWLTKNTFLKDTLLKRWPFMHALPKQIPLEILFLTGYMPDYVFGYSSSIFFALPPERILFYVQRPHDVYIPLLKQAGILTDQKIISLEMGSASKK